MDQALKDRRLWAVFALVVLVFVALFLWAQQIGGDDASEPTRGSLVEESPSGLPTDMTGIPTAVGPRPLSDGSATGDPSSPDTPTSETTDPESGLPWVSLDELPPEAAETVALIDSGSASPGAVEFLNSDSFLPERPSGYYTVHDVPSDASEDRIVAGSDGELYWTDDHYASFSRIDR